MEKLEQHTFVFVFWFWKIRWVQKPKGEKVRAEKDGDSSTGFWNLKAYNKKQLCKGSFFFERSQSFQEWVFGFDSSFVRSSHQCDATHNTRNTMSEDLINKKPPVFIGQRFFATTILASGEDGKPAPKKTLPVKGSLVKKMHLDQFQFASGIEIRGHGKTLTTSHGRSRYFQYKSLSINNY